MLTIVSDQASSNTDLPILGIDPLSDGVDPGGITFLFDMFKDFEASHAAAAYESADVITDLSETSDGLFDIATGPQTVTSGSDYGGADFSAVTANGNVVKSPTTALADIYSGDQHFMIGMWVVLPASGDFNTSGSLAPFFCSSPNASGYTATADIVTIAQQNGGLVSARRQTDGATAVAVSVTLDSAAYGKLALIIFWRDADGVGLRIKTSASDQTSTGTVGSDNVTDFSAQSARWGVTKAFTGTVTSVANWTLCKGWVENLELSGRDPATVFDAEYERVTARIAAMP